MINKLFIILLFLWTNIYSQNFTFIAEFGDFQEANSFSISPTGYIYVTDISTNEVYKLDTLGNIKKFIGGYGWSQSAFDTPNDIFATTLNVYVADKNNNRIQFFDKDLNYLSELNAKNYDDPNLSFAYPTGCGISNQGDLFILDSDNSRVLKYDLNGNFLMEIGSYDAGAFTLNDPKNLAVASNGNIFVIDGNQVFVFDNFGLGVSKIKFNIKPINLNITFDNLVVNDSNSIKIINLTKRQNKIIEFSSKLIKSDIKDAALFNGKLYVLTSKSIYAFKKRD